MKRFWLSLLLVVVAPCLTVAANGVELSLDVGDPELYLVRPKDNTPIAVVAANVGEKDISGQLAIEVESYDESKP